MSRYFVMNSKTKHSVDADAVVDQAVHFVFDSPCSICSLQPCCDIKYKGTCAVYRGLKCRLYSLVADNERQGRI